MTAKERKHCENGKMLLPLQELKKYFLLLLGLRQVVERCAGLHLLALLWFHISSIKRKKKDLKSSETRMNTTLQNRGFRR